MTRSGDLLDFGQLLKPLATINLPKYPTFLGNFCKGVKIYHFSKEIIFGATFIDFWRFFSGHTGWKHFWPAGRPPKMQLRTIIKYFTIQFFSSAMFKEDRMPRPFSL